MSVSGPYKAISKLTNIPICSVADNFDDIKVVFRMLFLLISTT